ncbi:alpha/beta fold hydrolase [Actinoplanes sp. NPDC051513]|uniref:alpha/beta fold hydrolase n=1 Tax=Actinoplanes sp. NPDC051513 TaxID=3363908 RepID=UPI00378C10E2
MTGHTLPPLRSTNEWPAPGGVWSYDTWGRHGRPVLLLPAVLFDRVSWWPVAADLRPHATVIAVDLPGHGGSDARLRYDPYELVDDLAALIADVGVPQAPIVVGHGTTAGLAALFASQYAVHAVVTVDADTDIPSEHHSYVHGMCLATVPAHYRDLVHAADNPDLLRAYSQCITVRTAPPPAAFKHARLAIHSQPPPSAEPDDGRLAVYHVPGRFAHLADTDRFVRDLTSLL